MDRYLQVARKVLSKSRLPLSAAEILRMAYQLQLVPRELYGRTQQKTMHARLASDILRKRSKSEFYRTGPGRFFLRSFQLDRTTPPRYRKEYQAPLRAAQLGRFDVIAIPRSSLSKLVVDVGATFPANLLAALPWRFSPLWNLKGRSNYIPLQFHLMILVDGRMLINKASVVDDEMRRRITIGLPGVVKKSDRSLFSIDEFGIVEAAQRTLMERYDIPGKAASKLNDSNLWSQALAFVDAGDDKFGQLELMVFIRLQCGGLTDIVKAISASPTGEWLPSDLRPNDVDRFDRWSARLLNDFNFRASLGI